MRLFVRRWWLWSAVALLLLSAAVLYVSFRLSHRDRRVTMDHLGKLKLGMHESNVREILGSDVIRIPCARIALETGRLVLGRGKMEQPPSTYQGFVRFGRLFARLDRSF